MGAGESTGPSRRKVLTMQVRWRAVTSIVFALMVIGASANAQARESTQVNANGQPNILVVVVDDQAKGTLDAMPIVRSRIKNHGVTLTRGVIPTSTCCPSRSALLSGQYARTTGVYDNVFPSGGWPTFYQSGAESHTIAVALKDAGYTTALFGKYLNGFGLSSEQVGPGYVPPGWDMFRAIYKKDGKPALSAGAYYNYDLVGTGAPESYGNQRADYSTDVVTQKAVQFINSPIRPPRYFCTTRPMAPTLRTPRRLVMRGSGITNHSTRQPLS